MRWLLPLCLIAASAAESADFRLLDGHGGPIMDVAVSSDGGYAVTASFDNSVGVWDLSGDTVRWLEGHAAAVKTVIFIDDTRAASGGDDFAIEIWDLAAGARLTRLEGHKGQVAGLAVSPDGQILASASWDGSIRLWGLPTGELRTEITGHSAAVNDVAFARDGELLYSASADGTIRVWDAATGDAKRLLVEHGFGVNTLALGEDWLAYGAVDGGTRVIDLGSDEELADLTLDRRPILAMALSDDDAELAVGDGEGFVMTVATEDWRITSDYRLAAGGPVWALDYTSDGRSLVSGGIDDAAYIWPVQNDLDVPIMSKGTRSFLKNPEEMTNGERQFQRKCSVCHSLADDGKRRAGPTLSGLFGRVAGTLPGYTYSETLRDLDVRWDDTTIDLLFDLGPDHYIPGSKMPMQRIVKPEDRRDLIRYLKDNT